MKYARYFLLASILTISKAVFAQSSTTLQYQIHQIIAHKQATVGVAISDEHGKNIVVINSTNRFPMQSVFKFPVALGVLHQVDQGHLSLEQIISISASDLDNDLYSPIRDHYPEGISLKLSQVLQFALAQSDNIATDKLLELVGGTKNIQDYIKTQGISDIAITYNEKEQQSEWPKQFENWITPIASNRLLEQFFNNERTLLSSESHKFLWDTMKSTTTGQESIRGNLPKETVVAHKTGHSGINAKGITAAVNDIGIVFLPNGHFFYISIFVGNSQEKEEQNQKIIADIAKVAWDYFSKYYN